MALEEGPLGWFLSCPDPLLPSSTDPLLLQSVAEAKLGQGQAGGKTGGGGGTLAEGGGQGGGGGLQEEWGVSEGRGRRGLYRLLLKVLEGEGEAGKRLLQASLLATPHAPRAPRAGPGPRLVLLPVPEPAPVPVPEPVPVPVPEREPVLVP